MSEGQEGAKLEAQEGAASPAPEQGGQPQEAPPQEAPAGVEWGASQPPEAPSADDKLWGMLANFLGLIPLLGPVVALLVKSNSKFVKFNALQILFLQLAMFLVGMAISIVGLIFSVIPGLNILAWLFFALISPFIGLAGLCLLVLLALKANNGVLYRLPVIGDLAFKNAYPESPQKGAAS